MINIVDEIKIRQKKKKLGHVFTLFFISIIQNLMHDESCTNANTIELT